MPICKALRSTSAGLGPALIMLLLPASPALAQDSTASAKSAIAKQGPAAMERLKGAIAAQQEHSKNAPGSMQVSAAPPPSLPETERRRAFEGLHHAQTSPVMEERARDVVARGHAALDAEREAMAKRVGQALGIAAPDQIALAGSLPQVKSKEFVPVIFASSSMPIAELRAYAAQIEPAHGVLAFRGMPGGMRKITPMARLTAQILRLDPGCEGPACVMRHVQVIVDPLVFRQHDVTRVPALTLVPGDPTQPYCEREDGSPTGGSVVYGDAALSGLLEEYARLGGKEEVRDVETRLERR